MYTLKGFFEFTPMVNNTLNQVARFGELSSNSLTYGRDKTQHTDSQQAPQTTLVSFHSVKDGDYEPVPGTLATTVLQVGQYILDQSLSGQVTDDIALLRNNLQQEFQDDIESVATGEMLEDNDGNFMPEWVRFEVTDEPTNEVTVWLADERFSRQYNDYIIEVIPPIAQLDDFFLDPLVVKQRLDAQTTVERMESIQVRRGDYPYTMVKAREYAFHDVNDDEWTYPTYWTVLIYGQAGNNPDIIKNAIADYVLANSAHTREEWVELLPDLFTTTEFIITPLWTQYAIPNRELKAGINSPVILPMTASDQILNTVKGPQYTTQFISTAAEFSFMLYKSLAFGVVGNPENREGVVRFSEQFPDYIVVANNSADFSRMSPRTQGFVSLLADLVHTAETFTDTSSVPDGQARLMREGILYVTARYENVTYLVVAKPQLTENQGGDPWVPQES